jgi:hypothetical protein
LTAVVVFPTPPFWLATAMTLVGTGGLNEKRGGVSSAHRENLVGKTAEESWRRYFMPLQLQ